ncbi:phosphoglucomutase/phosphomannomutase domain-containing protein [Ramicandelaber brevisporus]|nr:phosphoglucomutase/phosphomannomutase domain-containing protein [Ramicandelaber brevisporus]
MTSFNVSSSKVAAAAAKHPRVHTRYFGYGTAGFRYPADLLDSIVFRAGLVAVLRSLALNGKQIGVMITASHNPSRDNGVKLVEPLGEMLVQKWEKHAELVANATDDTDALVAALKDVISAEGISSNKKASIAVARDTRPSGVALTQAIKDAAEAFDGVDGVTVEVVDHELMTTPQLHYVVRATNTAGTADAYGVPTANGYYQKIGDAFKTLMAGHKQSSQIVVDCANGIGAPALRAFADYVGQDVLNVRIINDNTSDPAILNAKCGADHVKTQQTYPAGLDAQVGERYCAFDGDADRLVYFYRNEKDGFKLLDGDNIATLTALFIGDLVRAAGLGKELQVGAVQTAYANGSSTKFIIEELGLNVTCTATGVKHLHHAAENYDIGVYFEANGHGTVLFSDKARKAVSTQSGSATKEQEEARVTLRNVVEVINQAVGDALSDMLVVEAALAHKGWTLEDWDALYANLPNKLQKVVVSDRTAFTTTDAERKLVTPSGMQALIDAEVAKVSQGRSFVRPSGTEDVVRVYAEAATKEEVDQLSLAVSRAVFKNGGGVGQCP